MVTSYTTPPQFAPAKSDIWVNQLTNNIDSALRSSILLTLTNATDGQVLTISWGVQSLTFTFKTSPNTSGVQMQAKGALSLADWLFSIQRDLNLNAEISTVFLVELISNDIKLTYKDYDNTAIGATTTATGTIAVTQQTTAGYLKKNLSAFMRAALGETIYADFNTPYAITDRRAHFNLRSIFRRLMPFIPSSSMFAYHATTVAEACTNFVLRYRLFVADRYSVTNTALPTTEKLEDHGGDYHTVYASELSAIVGDVIALNPTYTRIVTPTQPNFIYFMATFPITTLTVRAIITKKDNTTVTVDRTLSTLIKGDAFAVKAGLTQLWNGDYNSVKSYEVQLRNGSTVAYSAVYSISEKCYKDVINVLVETPNGGFETLALRGSAITSLNAERDAAQITRSQLYTNQTGDIVEYSKTSQREWRIRTTLIENTEYPIYKALLTGVLYIINPDNTLEKVLLDNKKFDFDKISQSFDLTFKSAVVIDY